MLLKGSLTMNKGIGNIFVSFTDMSMCLLLLFICLFALTFIKMSEPTEDKKVDAKAEFILTMEWPDSSDDDIDFYLQDPLGNIAFFRAREVGLIHLDRDDLGSRNDKIRLADGSYYEVKENREIITIRGIVPGEYTVNGHMYLRKDQGEKTKVKVILTKVNPSVQIVQVEEFELGASKDEHTAFRFTLDKDGEVSKINKLQKTLANQDNRNQIDEFGVDQ